MNSVPNIMIALLKTILDKVKAVINVEQNDDKSRNPILIVKFGADGKLLELIVYG